MAFVSRDETTNSFAVARRPIAETRVQALDPIATNPLRTFQDPFSVPTFFIKAFHRQVSTDKYRIYTLDNFNYNEI